jgi:hypothetical protein
MRHMSTTSWRAFDSPSAMVNERGACTAKEEAEVGGSTKQGAWDRPSRFKENRPRSRTQLGLACRCALAPMRMVARGAPRHRQSSTSNQVNTRPHRNHVPRDTESQNATGKSKRRRTEEPRKRRLWCFRWRQRSCTRPCSTGDRPGCRGEQGELRGAGLLGGPLCRVLCYPVVDKTIAIAK